MSESHQVDGSTATRRQLVAGAAVSAAGIGALAVPGLARAGDRPPKASDPPQLILNVAATAEVLATIVNTIGFERELGGDAVTQRNIRAAAREELIHYQVLTSRSVGARALTKRIWVPDVVFSSRTALLNTLQVGDQIFINAYMIGTTVFGNAGNGTLARITSEFMGAEAVHRALARQSLGQLGNDRVFMKYDQVEEAPGAPNRGTPGFTRILGAVAQLQAAGFGFGKQGATPGRFYEFDQVSRRTPDDPDVNTRLPR